MPDIVSHIASGFIARHLFPRWESCRRAFPLLLFGTLLPDLLARSLSLIHPVLHLPAQYFHTPFACLLQSLCLAAFFVPEQRRLAFRAVNLGWILHQGFDLLQGSLAPSVYYIFWPLSGKAVSLNLIWNGHWPYISAATVAIALATHDQARRRMRAWLARRAG